MSHGREPDVAELLDPELAGRLAETMQALATPSRLRILARLHGGPCSVGELAADVAMEPSAVSHQLRTLRHLGLVTGRRNGRQVRYELYDEHVAQLLEEAMSHVEHLRLGLAGRTARGVALEA
jgi:DNA-binding transcriptional ArsR family regulator